LAPATIIYIMMKQIERQIRDPQKELNEAQKKQSALRLQPCKGDATIRKKEEKLEELDERIRSIRESIRELERKRQEVMSEPLKKNGYESPFIRSSRKMGGEKISPRMTI
jgi:septal ring factor EnvC (AmiA/AmiB activator)